MMRNRILLAALFAIAGADACWSNIVISKAATSNMNCSGGTCTPTKDIAVLNVNDLETMLSSGDLQVNVQGVGRVDARNIIVAAPVTWSAATTLTLTAIGSYKRNTIQIKKHIAVAGAGNLVLDVEPLDLVLDPKVSVKFANDSSALSIDGVNYQLVGTLAALAAGIAANPSGNFALARSYDASADGTYTQSPITTNFLGSFEGLGNTILNISVNNSSACCAAGLFLSLSQAYVYDIHLANINLVSTGGAAGFAYESFANIYNSSVTGTITGGSGGDVGGFIGDDYGQLESVYSTATVSAGSTETDDSVGGLVGVESGMIDESFASGNVSANGSGDIGGLVGTLPGVVGDCYATGAVSGGTGVIIGGLIGKNTGGHLGACYSTGAASGGSGSIAGGFIGENDSTAMSDDYWDTTTSGTNIGVGLGNASNITGLTTEQLQSGLPPGFEQGIWVENAGINNGFPYLETNPPPK